MEKYRVEERLRQSQRELSWMVENSPDAILRIEFDLGAARCNPAAEEMLGLRRGTHIKYDSVLEHIHPDDRRKIRELKQMSFEDRRQETLTFRWMKDGEIEIWLEASVIPIILDRKPIGIELIARDITDQMRTEETLRRKLEIE